MANCYKMTCDKMQNYQRRHIQPRRRWQLRSRIYRNGFYCGTRNERRPYARARSCWCEGQAFAISAFSRTLAATGNQKCITSLSSERPKITVAGNNWAAKKSVANNERLFWLELKVGSSIPWLLSPKWPMWVEQPCARSRQISIVPSARQPGLWINFIYICSTVPFEGITPTTILLLLQCIQTAYKADVHTHTHESFLFPSLTVDRHSTASGGVFTVCTDMQGKQSTLQV